MSFFFNYYKIEVTSFQTLLNDKWKRLMIGFKMWVHKSDMYWLLKYDTIQHRIRLSKLHDIANARLAYINTVPILVCVKSCGFPIKTH